MDYKKNVVIKVNYLALKKTEGLLDLTVRVYNPLNSLVDTVVLTEVNEGSGLGGGLYEGSFTPTTDGQWRIRITSDTNGDDVAKIFDVGNYNIDDVKAQGDAIEDKIDIIDANVDLIKTETDKIQVIDDNVDSIKSDVTLIKAETDKIQTIDNNVDTINSNVSIIKTKTDNLPIDTASELSYIKNKVDSIDGQINIGGYIL